MSETQPLISIIIVNWNGRKWLEKCLDSLYQQTYKDFEIIFVDNASTDDSVHLVRKLYPEVIIVQNKHNDGFAGGNNKGFGYSNGKYILLLNNDTWVEESYLENFVKAFEKIPQAGCIQSKILLMDQKDVLDVCGSYWTSSTFLYHYGHGASNALPMYNSPKPFFSNKGASMMIRRTVIEKAGELFDDDFWCYYEETDFCHRVWLMGYECWYYPKAVAHHANGGTSLNFQNDFIHFHNFKNKLLSFLKNFETTTLIRVIPMYLFLNGGLSLYWLFCGKKRHFTAFYKALWWNIVHFRKTIYKRKIVQSLRVKCDHDIFKKVKKNPRIIYYYHLLNGVKKYEE